MDNDLEAFDIENEAITHGNMRNDLDGASFDGNLTSNRSNYQAQNTSALDYSESENVTPRPEVIK